MAEEVADLLSADDPALRYRTLVEVCGAAPDAPEVREVRAAIPFSPRVQRLLSLRNDEGRIPGSVYAKYTGAHWVLADLADLGYPSGDASLVPLRDQVYERWLAPSHTQERVVGQEAARYKSRSGVPIIEGRARRCASQEGNALHATLKLGLADARAEQLAANLIRWQWPDGGWNCDRKADAHISSFHESLLPLRGLALYAQRSGDPAAQRATERAVEIFLQRRLFRRLTDGSVIHASFLKLRYPRYWHYDLLIGLRVMTEAGFLSDPRCGEALDMLEAKALPGGSWRAEGKQWRVVETPASGGSMVNWGPISRKAPNPWVTLEALSVLRAAGRLDAKGAEA